MLFRFRRDAFHVLFLVLAAAGIACEAGSRSPVVPGPTNANPNTSIAAEASSAPGSIIVCHRTERGFVPLPLPTPAVELHLNHGDGVVGGAVPGQPGMTFDANCAAVTTGTIVTFAGLTIHEAPFATYTESGFTITSTQGSWEVWTTYGNPEPFIVFDSPAQAPVVNAAITVSAGGELFSFASVDVYSSITPIPYVFTGIRNGTTVFTASDIQPNTFGGFATVQNPYSSENIDTLVITLSNPADVCCPNSTGLDNIVLVD
jgi:hypothetical protein